MLRGAVILGVGWGVKNHVSSYAVVAPYLINITDGSLNAGNSTIPSTPTPGDNSQNFIKVCFSKCCL